MQHHSKKRGISWRESISGESSLLSLIIWETYNIFIIWREIMTADVSSFIHCVLIMRWRPLPESSWDVFNVKGKKSWNILLLLGSLIWQNWPYFFTSCLTSVTVCILLTPSSDWPELSHIMGRLPWLTLALNSQFGSVVLLSTRIN